MKLMQNHLDKALREHKRIVELYKRKYSEDRKTRDGKRDWRTYEQRVALRIKLASKELEQIIKEAHSMIKLSRDGRGRPEEVPITKKVMLLLLKDIFQLSNRKMANMLAMFTALTGIDISYKSVERVYSNELARLIIHNTFIILTRKNGIKEADVSGDGTGYSLTITKHYRNEREKELKAKDNGKQGVNMKCFARAFALRDLNTGIYIGYGTSMRSEQEAFHKAMEMARETGIIIKSARLDKLYSYQSITKEFDKDTKIYLIPKSNATIGGSPEWKRIIKSYAWSPFPHLKEYFKRNGSESGFSVDKGLCGRNVWQRRDDRIDTSLMCKGVWHNLMRLC